MKRFLILALLAFSAPALATFEGVAPPQSDYKVSGFSRPCCGFVPTLIGKIMGTSQFLDAKTLGPHDFGRRLERPEEVGMTYTCRGGFVDISHLRDNADWAAHLSGILLRELGSGRSFEIRHEGGTETSTLVLPRLSDAELAAITPEKRYEIARALTFDIALKHEILTAFPMAVGAPKVVPFTTVIFNERHSAFSVEDAYSNLLGATLGVEAVRDPRPYNEAMTGILSDKLASLGVVTRDEAKSVFKSLKHEWWRNRFLESNKMLMKRNYDFQNVVNPRIPETERAKQLCGAALSEPEAISVPDIAQLTGLPAKEVAYVAFEPSKEFRRHLKDLGIELGHELAHEDYPRVIDAVHKDYRKKLGPKID